MVAYALLFDLDGTLVDSERHNAEALSRALSLGQSISIDQSCRDMVVGHSWVQIYRSIRERYPEIRWSQEELMDATAIERKSLIDASGLPVLPGAREAIARFSSIPRALVTGSSRAEMHHSLELLRPPAGFSVTVASEDVATSKPSPDGYLLAAEKLAVDKRHCVVIEDSTAGIAAGLAAGMTVIAVKVGNFSMQDQGAAHLQIDTLEELDEEQIARAMVRSL